MSFERPDLSGRVIVITGGSRGIGKCIALRAAECGADIVVAARSTKSRDRLPGSIHETVSEIEALGRRGLALRVNVRDVEAIDAMVFEAAAQMGRIDAVIHNAGALWWDTVENTPQKRFDLVMEVNVRAAFALSRAAVPHLRAGGGGHVILCSPAIDLQMAPGKVAYCISKFGMTLIAHGMSEEVRADGISVNALWPATMVESQATINHGLGTREGWRKADIMADATLAILARDAESLTGRALLDEEILAESGVTDFDPYACVPGSEPIRIVGEASASDMWKHRIPGSRA